MRGKKTLCLAAGLTALALCASLAGCGTSGGSAMAQGAWLDVNPRPTAADPLPQQLAGQYAPYREGWSSAQAGRAGYAVLEGSTLTRYATKDGGGSWQEIAADLSDVVEGPCCLVNHQMVDDDTGFVVLRMGTGLEEALAGPSLKYETGDDFAVLRTTDGGESWTLTGRQSLPAGQESWRLREFLWLSGEVGLFAPHLAGDGLEFCLWRTEDGGATWQPLDLSALLKSEDWQDLSAGFTEMGGADLGALHTCLPMMDPAGSGAIYVRCYGVPAGWNVNSAGESQMFYLVSDGLGSEWSLLPAVDGPALTKADPPATARLDGQAALDNAQAAWQETYGQVGYPYQQATLTGAEVVQPEDYPDIVGNFIFTNVDTHDTVQARLAAGCGQLVRVEDTRLYLPEAWYSGPQYSDGDTWGLYYCEPWGTRKISDYHTDGSGPAQPDPGPEAEALGLTARQYTMLTHQVAALYAAGLTDFTSSADWTEEELYRYLAARLPDFGTGAGELDGMVDAAYQDEARRILGIDFQGGAFYSTTQEGNTEPLPASLAKPADPPALPQLPALDWAYTRTGDTVTAAGSDANGAVVQQYTFGVAAATDLGWDDRTWCTGAQGA